MESLFEKLIINQPENPKEFLIKHLRNPKIDLTFIFYS